MARKRTKSENAVSLVMIVFAMLIAGIAKFFEIFGWVIPALLVVAVIAFSLWYQHVKKQKHLAALRKRHEDELEAAQARDAARLIALQEKYGDEQIVQKIFQGLIWQGQTEEQLLDAIGSPVNVDSKVLKTKKKEIWKYDHWGSNRYGLRITVENGRVTGWDKKA